MLQTNPEDYQIINFCYYLQVLVYINTPMLSFWVKAWLFDYLIEIAWNYF